MPAYDRQPPRYPVSAYVWPLLLLLVVVVALLLRYGDVFRSFWPFAATNPAAQPREPTPRGDLGADEQATIAVYKRCAPSVVHITSLAQKAGSIRLNVQQVPRGTGSGFIWDSAGRVVTNYHVVEPGNAWEVTLNDHSTWKARLVGAYPDKDLAVLQIDAPEGKLKPIDVGTSDDLQVGQTVFAIGNPFGLDQSLTKGIISALNREIESVTERPIRGVIQTDAAINPGNSGGPLLDTYGRLIGVNTAIASPTGAYAGIGFAIPVDEVNRIVPQIIAHGKIVQPGIGAQFAGDDLARRLRVSGVLVLDVNPGSEAEKAGLRPTRRDIRGDIIRGDIIQAVNDKPVKTTKDLFDALEQYKVGDTVKLKMLRGQDTVELSVKLEAVD